MANKTLIKKENKNTTVVNNGKVTWVLLIALVAPVILYYTWTRGFVYFSFSREIYTDYFWYRAPWLFVHVIAGLVATLIGPLQFVSQIRIRHRELHRKLGKVYMGSIVLSTVISFYLVYTSQLGFVYAVGLATLGIVWLVTTAMAYFSIRKRNIEMHKEWMVKSYVLTVAFVSFRFVEDILAAMDISTFVDRKILMAWGCWAIPFFITEVVLQLRRLFR